jgi:hypothetical protein
MLLRRCCAEFRGVLWLDGRELAPSSDNTAGRPKGEQMMVRKPEVIIKRDREQGGISRRTLRTHLPHRLQNIASICERTAAWIPLKLG